MAVYVSTIYVLAKQCHVYYILTWNAIQLQIWNLLRWVCHNFLLLFFLFTISEKYQKFRCTWINSLFKIGWFLLEFFFCFCQNRQRQGYQVFLMVYYCQFAVKIGQIVSKNATLLKMEITLLVINFKYLEILLLVKTIDQKLVAMTFEK